MKAPQSTRPRVIKIAPRGVQVVRSVQMAPWIALVMALLVPFLLFGCSGGKTEKSDAGAKSKDVQVQTTGSEEQRKLAMGATAVPGVSVSAVFGADADKLMAFGLKELGKSGDSFSLDGPVYKLSATAELTPGPDGCYAILPVTSGSVCFDEKISATRFLIPIVAPGTAAAPGLGLTVNAVKYSSFDEICLKAGLNVLCYMDSRPKIRSTQPVPAQAPPENRAPEPVNPHNLITDLEKRVAVFPQSLPKERIEREMPVPIPAGQPRAVVPVVQGANTPEYVKQPFIDIYEPLKKPIKIPSGDNRAVPPPGENMVAQPASAGAESDNGELKTQVMPVPVPLPKLPPEIHNDLEQLRIQKIKEEEDRRLQESLARAEEQDRINNEERLRQEVWRKGQATVRPEQIPEPVYPMPETMSTMPQVTEVLIDTGHEKGSPTDSFQLPGITGDNNPDAGIKQPSETVSDPSESVVEVGEKTLLQLPPPDCRTVMCAQVKVSKNCIEPKFETPPGECCAKLVCAGGYSNPNGQECEDVMCPQVMPAPGCIDPTYERDGCCERFVGCAGGYSTPTGQNCRQVCASCSIDLNGKMVCPEKEKACTVECT